MKKFVVFLMAAFLMSVAGTHLHAQLSVPPDGTYEFNGNVVVNSNAMEIDLIMMVIKEGNLLLYYKDTNQDGLMAEDEWESMMGMTVTYLGASAFSARSEKGPLILFYKDEIGQYMFRASEYEVVVVFEMERIIYE